MATKVMDKTYKCNILSCGELSYGETASGEFLQRAYGDAANVKRLVDLGALIEVADDDTGANAPLNTGQQVPPTDVTGGIKTGPVDLAPTTEGKAPAKPAVKEEVPTDPPAPATTTAEAKTTT